MLVLLRCFSYTPHASFSDPFLLHTSSQFYGGVSLIHFMLVLVMCFSCTPDDASSEVFLLHTSC